MVYIQTHSLSTKPHSLHTETYPSYVKWVLIKVLYGLQCTGAFIEIEKVCDNDVSNNVNIIMWELTWPGERWAVRACCSLQQEDPQLFCRSLAASQISPASLRKRQNLSWLFTPPHSKMTLKGVTHNPTYVKIHTNSVQEVIVEAEGHKGFW